jgi:epoxyqueuosine reductase
VCPWNSSKFVQITGEAGFDGRERDRERLRKRERAGTAGELPGTSLPSLISLMAMTHEEWNEWTRGSAIRRSGYAGLKRNVAVDCAGQLGFAGGGGGAGPGAVGAEPLVRGHAAWALGRVGSADARSTLLAHASMESNASVLEELSAATDA